MRREISMGILGLALIGYAASGRDHHAAAHAFDKLKGLDGHWIATEMGQDFDAQFESIAKGAAVMQKSGFTAIFSPDGDGVLLTLYPDDGYTARLHSKTPAVDSTSLRFTFVDATNLARGADRVNALDLSFPANGHVLERWEFREKGSIVPLEIDLRRAPGQ